MMRLFVPCATPLIGRGYMDTASSNPQPGVFYYECSSASGPRVLQTINEQETNGRATESFARTVVDTLDLRSFENQFPDIDPWFEIPSPGPSGSRAFKRQLRTIENASAWQIEVFTVQGRHVVGVVLDFPQDRHGQLNYTPAHAGEILTALLARVPS